MNDVTTEEPEGSPPSGPSGPPPPGGPPPPSGPGGPPPPGGSPPPSGRPPLSDEEKRRRERQRLRRQRWQRFVLFVRAYDRIIILGLVVVALFLAFGLPRRHQGDDDGPGLGRMPAFTIEFRDEHTMHVLTDVTARDQVELVFDEVREGQQDGDYWDVVIRCASIPEEVEDTRIAIGRFANTALGQEITGLESDEEELQLTGRSTCAPAPPTVPGAVTPEEVFADVEAAGLEVINPRDASDACAQIDCLRRTLTDQFTVIVWPDQAAAERWADIATIDVWQVGPVTTVQVNEGGFDPEGPERFRYESAFADIAAAAGTPGPSPATSSPVGDVAGT
jgi:hypothetical protein